ncbi:hypothetical protein QX220_09080 [Vibrio vulnificus]|nr:hypothetical protein [Vibrio vulnificus]
MNQSRKLVVVEYGISNTLRWLTDSISRMDMRSFPQLVEGEILH